MDFINVLRDTGVTDLETIVKSEHQTFLCFTKTKQEDSQTHLQIEISDGVELWISELDQKDVETQKDVNDISSVDAFLIKIRLVFTPYCH